MLTIPDNAAPSQIGFTLVELSIVLVIVGLIIGGILYGQTMIKSAEIRAAISETEKFTAATYTFKTKYNGLPGDFSNATDFWGAADPDPNTCKTTIGAGYTTCNGDGSGTIGDQTAPMSYEWYRFWHHLFIAGLIKGSYTGVQGPGGVHDAIVGTNIPETPIPGSGFAISWRSPIPAGHAHLYEGTYATTLVLGAPLSGNFPYSAILTPTEAHEFDCKIDDCKPAVGIVRALKSTSTYTPGCTTTDVVATAEYAATQGKLCSLLIKMAF